MNLKIYIADDDEDSRDLLMTALEYKGYSVSCFSSGHRLYLQALKEPPDIIVSDVLMPDMDGYELCRKIKDHNMLCDIPFIFCSGTYLEESEARLALDLGAIRYVIKPIDIPEFIEMINSVTSEKKKSNTDCDDSYSITQKNFDEKYTEILSNKIYQKVQELEHQNKILEGKESELRLIADAIPELISEIGLDYSYRFVNREFLRWHEVDKSVCVGMKVVDILGDELFSIIKPHLDSAIAGEEVTFELPMINGKRNCCLSVRYFPLRDEFGDVVAVISLSKDVTEKRVSAIRLNNLNKALKVLAHCNDALVHTSSEDELLHAVCEIIVNEGEYKFAWVGLSLHNKSKDVKPATSAGFDDGYLESLNVSWGDNEYGQGPTGRAIRTGQVCSNMNIFDENDYSLWRAEALRRNFHSSIALPLLIEDHVIGALNIYSTDAYAFDDEAVRLLSRLASNLSFGIQTLRNKRRRKQAEEELQRSEREFRNILDNMIDTYYRTDRDGHVTLVSPSVNTLLGYMPGELLGKNASEVYFTPSDRDEFLKVISENNGRVKGYEAVLRRKDGTGIWVSTSARYVYDGKGDVAGIEGVVRDITESKKSLEERELLYRQLQQAQKMEAIGQLTGGIAHDFNNILASILGYTGLALERFVPDKSSKLHDYLREVYSAGERARDLISQMLTFSRGGASNFQPVVMSKLIDESLKMLRPMMPSTIEISTDIDQSLPLVNGDAVIIHQMIMNLCINARDAIDKHGTIAIKLAAVKSGPNLCNSCHREIVGRYIDFSVTDDGCGMSPEVRARIFEPFFSTKDTGKGTGMGLSMVHGIVHEHHGHIIVDSQPGHGASFHILLPIADSSDHVMQDKPDVAAPALVPYQQCHILLVDDELAVGSFVCELLEMQGWDTTLFNNPVEALDYFKSNYKQIDLVITDQTMPKMTGLEMAKSMLELSPEMPIIICSGYNDDIDEKNANTFGVESYLAKPIDSNRLLAKVSAILHDKQINAT